MSQLPFYVRWYEVGKDVFKYKLQRVESVFNPNASPLLFPSDAEIKKMTLEMLREELRNHALEPKQRRDDMVAQLQDFVRLASTDPQHVGDTEKSNDNSLRKKRSNEEKSQSAKEGEKEASFC